MYVCTYYVISKYHHIGLKSVSLISYFDSIIQTYYSFSSNINNLTYFSVLLRSLAALNEVSTKDLKAMSSESLKHDTEEIIVVHVTEEEDYR